MEFMPDSIVIVNPLKIKQWIIDEQEDCLLLFFTGKSRNSTNIIEEQKENIAHCDGETIEAMHRMKQSVDDMKYAILNGDTERFAYIICENRENKKKTASHISNPVI